MENNDKEDDLQAWFMANWFFGCCKEWYNFQQELPYTAKLSSGKTFVVFADFQPIAKVFPLNHLLCTVHDGHGLMHRKNFPVNSIFCAQPRKFSHSKVLLYTVMVSKTVVQVFIISFTTRQ